MQSKSTTSAMREFKMAKGWAVFVYIGGPLLIALFGWMLVLPFYEKEVPAKAVWFLVPIALAMIVVMILGLIDAYKGRFIIQADRMTTIGVLSNRELRFEEVRGYRVAEHYIFVESAVPGKKRIKISKYTGGYNEILYWLSQQFDDLDRVSASAEEAVILEDVRLGWSKEEREAKLARARKICKVLNLVATIAALYTLFHPEPYSVCMGLMMLLPVVGLVVMRLHPGLIWIDEKKGSAYPSLILCFLMPAAALMVRSLIDYEIFDYTPVWKPVILLAAVFVFLLLFRQGKYFFQRTSDYWSALFVGIFMLGYSYGAIVQVNCYYDQSAPTVFSAEVLNKRKSTGKTTTYYLDLSAWGRRTAPEEAGVSSDLYNRVEAGDMVNIYFKPGRLGIAWFSVSDR